jgi:hypothetical protein
MGKIYIFLFSVIVVFIWQIQPIKAQEVQAKNSLKLDISGRVQLQHVYNSRLRTVDEETYHGFRMRRVRLEVQGELTPFLSATIQVDARDNAPRLKDGFGKMKLFQNYYFRFGQFKVPVWREEFRRSSGDLFLVERSSAAEFLVGTNLSARQIGIEAGGSPFSHFSFVVNYSNGSGEGASEIERNILGTDDVPLLIVNNGKMYVGRMDYNFSDQFKVGISGAVNYVGSKVDTINNSGKNTLIAPDFGIYLPLGLQVEGGLAFGAINRAFFKGAVENQTYTIGNLSGRWRKIFKKESPEWGGLSGYELEAGYSFINLKNAEFEVRNSFAFGPAAYFGKKSRLQVNLELINPAVNNESNYWRIRSQFTVNL